MADAATGGASAPKPSSSVKLVLLGEAAVGKVCVWSSIISVWSYRTHQIGLHVVVDVVSLCVGPCIDQSILQPPVEARRRIYRRIEGIEC
jgi:GTPase SAR1 family protein